MIEFPPDSPDWLEPVLTGMQERAEDMVCNGQSSERGAGYLKAVHDFKTEIEHQSQLHKERLTKALQAVKVR
jgi:hypothetical protein